MNHIRRTVRGSGILAAFVAAFGPFVPSPAAITTGGDTLLHSSGSTYVGRTTVGTLAVNAGDVLYSDSGYLGYNAAATGTVAVTGSGSKWSTTSVHVGRDGGGTLNVTAGGQVAGNYVYLGSTAGSTGAVTVGGPSSMLTVRTALHVGSFGSGSINVADGGRVEAQYSYIGYGKGSAGSAEVVGVGSVWNSYSLSVGTDGSGTLSVTNGGQVTTRTLFASLGSLHGNGRITANGWVADANLSFDATHGTTQSVAFGAGGTLELNVDGTGAVGVGHKGGGSLRVADGVTVGSLWGYVGLYPGSTGIATVEGPGSSWAVANDLVIGNRGDGTLRIEAGASVDATNGQSAYSTHVGRYVGSSGALVVSGTGSKFTENGPLDVGSEGVGTFLISGGGTAASGDAGLGGNAGGFGAATVTGPGSAWTARTLNIANQGRAILRIESSGQLTSGGATIGHGYSFDPTGDGEVIVSGPGSKWTDTSEVAVGSRSKGKLSVVRGGQVDGMSGIVGSAATATGTAVVSGAGSKWASSSTLTVGGEGKGALTVADGGRVTAEALRVNASSVVRLHVSGDGMLVLGSASKAGTIANDGAIRMYADALLPAGVYRPFAEYAARAVGWSGTGSYAATGGAWDGANRTFVVPPTTPRTSGETIVASAHDRLLFTHPFTDARAGLSFGAVTGTVELSAVPASGGAVAELRALIGAGAQVLAAWELLSNVGFAGEAFLSFDIGDGADALRVWRRNAGGWLPYDANLLTYDSNGLASFTITTFGGYAVSGRAARVLGDANGDGAVDATDLAALLNGMASNLTGLANGDFNGDGRVTADDLALFNLYYSQAQSSGAPMVPEPAAVALLGFAATTTLHRRRGGLKVVENDTPVSQACR